MSNQNRTCFCIRPDGNCSKCGINQGTYTSYFSNPDYVAIKQEIDRLQNEIEHLKRTFIQTSLVTEKK